MANSAIAQAIKQICEEKNIPESSVIETIEAALAVAYRKDFGEKNQNIRVEFSVADGSSRVFDVKTVVEDALFEKYEAERAEREKLVAEGKLTEEEAARVARTAEEPLVGVPGAEPAGDKEPRFDPRKHVALSEARKGKPDAELAGEIRVELFPPAAYGRMAAQTAKQVIIQRIREAERDMIFREYKDKEGKLLTATVQRVEGRLVFVDLGHATAIMPPGEQMDREYYRAAQRIKVFVVAVNSTSKGPEIIVSRSHPELVRQLFAFEVPEIASGAVEIKAIAREAGSRTKIAVHSTQKNVDPVGSCVGQRGSRVQTVISELAGEKIDIVEWSDDPVKFLGNALSPAKVLSIKLDDAQRLATAEVKNDQLSLAIGRSGQNVRLASKLTGWRIDIVGEEGEQPAELPAVAPTAPPPDEPATSIAPSTGVGPEAEAAGASLVPTEHRDARLNGTESKQLDSSSAVSAPSTPNPLTPTAEAPASGDVSETKGT
jgi:N utilization substance protein A